MRASLVALVAPPRCLACTAPTRAGERLCRACREELPWITNPCERCGLPVPCRSCPGTHAAFSAAWSPVAFDGPARALVHALKFGGRPAAAHVMAAQMAANAPAGAFGEGAWLVGVPTHPARRRRRGFDQAQLLARALGRRTQLPVLAALSRHGPATRQLGAGRAARSRGVTVRATRPISGAVVLVDDVHTTGATLDACARALREAGATDVTAVTYARTLG